MTYLPDIKAYQQLVYGGATRGVDCSAWSAALLVDAHTTGVIKVSGRAIRLRTDEPVPDPDSPGLNLPQVDEAALEITTARGKPVDLDTRVGLRSLSRADIKFRIVDGRWAAIQVDRSVLVNRGFGGTSGFRGGHDLTVHTAIGFPDIPVLGDPLVPYYIRASWDALFDAAEAFANGRIYAQFTRDLTPDYAVTIDTGTEYRRFHLNDNGRIVRVSRHVAALSPTRPCSVPRYHGAAAGKPTRWGRQLVQIHAPGHVRDGWWVSARWASEVNP